MNEPIRPDLIDARLINPLDGPDWDSGLKAFPQATFFHSTAWVRVLYETYGFHPYYLLLDGDEGGLLSVVEVNSWLTGRRGASLPFTDECAALAHTSYAANKLIGAAIQLGRTRKWKYWDYRGGASAWAESTPSEIYYHHRLELSRNTDALFSHFESSTRTAIRKAENTGLTVEFHQTHSAVQEFYELVELTRRRQGLPPQPRSFFDNIYHHVISPGLGSLILARLNGRSAAGAMFFHSGNSVIYKFGASDEAFQDLRPNNLVMWRAIEHFSKAGFSFLDFGRTSLANAGLRRFKRAWGAQESTLEYIKWSEHKGFLRNPDRSSGWHSRFFRSMPRPLSRLIGVMAYRHIA